MTRRRAVAIGTGTVALAALAVAAVVAWYRVGDGPGDAIRVPGIPDASAPPRVADVAWMTVRMPIPRPQQPVPLASWQPGDRTVIERVTSWFADASISGPEPDKPLAARDYQLVLGLTDGAEVRVMPAYDCTGTPAGAGRQVTCAPVPGYVAFGARGRGRESRLWAPRLAEWLAGPWKSDFAWVETAGGPPPTPAP